MSDLIKSSAWNISGSVIIKVLSFVTIPFLTKYYLKGDVATLRAVQSLIALLITTISMGTNYLYLSEEKTKRQKYWNLFILTSGLASVIVLVIIYLIGDIYYRSIPHRKIFFLTVVFIQLIKISLNTQLVSEINFKYITLSILIKQIVVNVLIISFGFINPQLSILIRILLIAEVVEISFLGYFNKFRIIPLIKPFCENLNIDRKAKKYLILSGGEGLLVNLALQLPNIVVVGIMSELAAEFQMPLVLVGVPATLIMRQVAQVIFPFLSNNRDNETIKKVFNYTHYIFIVVALPVFFGISYFSREISSFMFNPEWKHAYIALQYFPIFMFVNMLQNPMSSLALIKNKPIVGFTYSFCLLLFRLAAIKYGYENFGFLGSVIFFTASDTMIRFARLLVDLRLINIKFSSFYKNIQNPLLILGSGGTTSYILLNLGVNKVLSFIVSWLIFGVLFLLKDQERLKRQFQIIKNGILKKG